METRPTSRSRSTTGMWRNRRVVISVISWSTVSASRAVITVLVMKFETGSAKVDHLCRRSDQRRDLVIIANGDNAVACEGDRLLGRARRVGRVNLPLPEHHIRLSILGGPDIVKPETGDEANDDR